MAKVVINNFKEFETYLGKEIGLSDYHKITQEQINLFAEATIDHQWIHTDPKRAAIESPYKSTIAHGYLTLSLLPHLWLQLVEFKNVKLMVNYGIESLKFNQPVLVNDSVRVRVFLNSLIDLRGITKATMKVKLEIEGQKKTAYDALIVFLYHFND